MAFEYMYNNFAPDSCSTGYQSKSEEVLMSSVQDSRLRAAELFSTPSSKPTALARLMASL
jgi:hypothetical protein